MKRSTRQILSRCLPAAWLVLPLLMFSNPAHAAEANMTTDTEADADAIQNQFKGRYDYNSLMAVKLADVAIEEKSQHDHGAARQFIHLAESYAAKAGGAK